MRALSTDGKSEDSASLAIVYKGLNYNNRDNDEVKFLRGLEGAAHAVEVFGPKGVWVYNLLLDFLKSPAGTVSLEKLLDSAIERKNVSGDKAKCIAEIGQFWEKLSSRARGPQKQQKPLTTNQAQEDIKKQKAKPQKALQEMNAGGDDRDLSTHGSDRGYWYSIRDGMSLLVAIRKRKLGCSQAGYTEYTESKEGVFIANPYHELNFEESLLGDIERIMGGHGIQAWKQKPKVMIIPVLSGLHWRCIRIEINYNTKQGSILFDDPYGKGRFDERLKDRIRNSIKEQLPKLFLVEAKEVGYAEYEKAVNQQGDNNGSDCGPIVFGNVEDYCDASKANRSFTTKDGFTIVSEASDSGHNKTMEDLRVRHIKRFNKVSGTPINEERLKSVREAISRSNNEKKSSFSSNDADIISQIEILPAEYVSHIFNAVDLGISLKEAYESIIAERRIYETQSAAFAKEYMSSSSKAKPDKMISLKKSWDNNTALSRASQEREYESSSRGASKPKEKPSINLESIHFEERGNVDKKIELQGLNTLQAKLRDNYLDNKYLPKLLEDDKFAKQEIESTYVNLMLIERDEKQNSDKGNKEVANNQRQIESNVYGSYEDIRAKKREISLESIFDSESDSSKLTKRINKVLIYGRAGIGKTTLCNYISYKWAKPASSGNQQALWQDKFDYVFWLPLRNLSGDWNTQHQADIGEYALECFIKRYCLDRDRSFSVKDIAEVIEKGKVLLILDGYDEIASLHNEEHIIVKDVIDSVAEIKNPRAKVIMTSRPNAVGQALRGKFDVEIENIGLKEKDVYEYISKYKFKVERKAKSLVTLVERHGQIESIAKVPINLYLLCLTWDNDVLKSQTDITVTGLYEEVASWLMRRYLGKFKKKKLAGVDEDGVEELCGAESLSLEAIAYCGVKKKTAILRKEERRESGINWDKLSALKELGILSGKGREENVQEYEFIHLTFQEYFAAKYIMRLLLSKDLNKVKEAVKFLGDNKYDRVYERVILFVAGLATLEFEKRNNKQGLQYFWNVIINGNVDLICRNQVRLLIRCLEEGKCSEAIPGLESLFKMIRDSSKKQSLFLENLRISVQVMSKSGVIKDKLKGMDNNASRRMAELLSYLRIDAQDMRNELIKILLGALKKGNIFERVGAAEALSRLKIGNVDEQKVVEEVMERLLEALKDLEVEVRSKAAEALKDLEVGVRSKAAEALGSLKIDRQEIERKVIAGLLEALRKEKEWFVRNSIVKALGKHKASSKDIDIGISGAELVTVSWEILILGTQQSAVENQLRGPKAIGYGVSSSAERRVIEFKTKTSEKTDEKEVRRLLEALKDSKEIVRRSAAGALGNLKIEDRELQQTIVKGLLEALKDSKEIVRRSAAGALGNLKIEDRELQQTIAQGLLEPLKDSEGGVRDSVAYVLRSLKVEDRELQQTIAQGLLEPLKDSEGGVRNSAAYALGRLKIEDKDLQKAIAQGLLEILKDSKKEVRRSAAYALGRLKIEDKDLQKAIAQGLLEILKDSKEEVRRSAVDALGNLNIEDRELQQTIAQGLLEALKDSKEIVRRSAADALGHLKIEDKEVKPVVVEILGVLKDPNEDIRSAAADALGRLRIKSKEVRLEVLKALIDTLKDHNGSVRSSIAGSLRNFKVEDIDIRETLVGALLEACQDHDEEVRSSIVEVLKRLNIEGQAVGGEVFEVLQKVISKDTNPYYARCSAIEALSRFRIESIIDAKKVVQALVKACEGHDKRVRISAAEVLRKLKVADLKTQEAVVSTLLEALKSYNLFVCRSTIRALVAFKIESRDIQKRVVEVLFEYLISKGLEKDYDIMKATNSFIERCAIGSTSMSFKRKHLPLLSLDIFQHSPIVLSDSCLSLYSKGYKAVFEFDPTDKELPLKVWEHFRKQAEKQGLPTDMLDNLVTGRPWIEIEGIDPEIDRLTRARITKHQEDIMIVRDNLELGSFSYADECRVDLISIKEGGHGSENLITKYKGQEDSPILIVAMEELRDDPSNAQIEVFLSELLANKIGLGAADSRGNTVAHYAMRHKRADVLKLVVDEGFYSKDTTNSFGANVLHTAVYYDMAYELDRMLGEGNCSFDQKADLGDYTFTPIELAVALGKVMAIELIFSMSGLGSTSKWCDQNILNIAIKFKQEGALHYLIYQDKQPISANTLQDAYLYAAREGNINALIIIQRAFSNDKFKGHCSITKAGSNGNTALHEAVLVGNKEVITYLLVQDRELINKPNNAGKTPVGLAKQEIKRASSSNEPQRSVLYTQIKNILRVEVGLADRKRFEIPEITKVPIKNLVIKGGGPKGIAFIGALEEFGEERLKGVERVAGTSAGAITAGLLAVGYKPIEIRGILNNLNLLSLIDSPNQEALLKLVKSKEKLKEVWNQKGAGGHKLLFEIISELGESNGLCSGDEFEKIMEGLISKKVNKSNFTLGELASRVRKGEEGYKELYVVTLDIEAESVEKGLVILSTEDERYKDVSLAAAIRASMSIPVVFKPKEIKYREVNGEYKELKCMDGGTVYNYPIDLFDKVKFRYTGRMTGGGAKKVYNEYTLGLSLYSQDIVEQSREEEKAKSHGTSILEMFTEKVFGHMTGESLNKLKGEADSIKGIVLRVINLIGSAELVKGSYWEDNDKPRTVNINCLGVGLLDFDLDQEMKDRLIEEGTRAFREKFEMEKSEVPRRDEVRKLLSLTTEPGPTAHLAVATSTWIPPIVADNPKTSVAIGLAAIAVGAVVYARQEDGDRCVLF